MLTEILAEQSQKSDSLQIALADAQKKRDQMQAALNDAKLVQAQFERKATLEKQLTTLEEQKR
ncbi:Uncharacterised protein [Weissella viridescens]|uniref:Uncharacterized protein n=1 Tax=Weissella viridescens TaxID=1629 RepID=A0A380P220_WEIVI|nr:Uncharacterised protein [Weissella viridescens]